MEALSILTPAPPAAAYGANHPPAGQASGAPRRAAAEGFAVTSLEKLLEAGAATQDQVALTSVKVELAIDKPTNRVVAIVRDRESGEVLNQFPAEAILRDARGIRELLARALDMKV